MNEQTSIADAVDDLISEIASARKGEGLNAEELSFVADRLTSIAGRLRAQATPPAVTAPTTTSAADVAPPAF